MVSFTPLPVSVDFNACALNLIFIYEISVDNEKKNSLSLACFSLLLPLQSAPYPFPTSPPPLRQEPVNNIFLKMIVVFLNEQYIEVITRSCNLKPAFAVELGEKPIKPCSVGYTCALPFFYYY